MLAAIILAVAAASAFESPRARAQTPPVAAPSAPVTSIAPLPAPSLPANVLAIAPLGTGVTTDTQIHVTFDHDIAPFGSIDAVSRRRLLAHFQLSPAWPGTFRIVTPRVVAFQTYQPLPDLTRFRVSVFSGADIGIAHPIAWTFETAGPAIAIETKSDNTTALRPVFTIASNLRLDIDSLRAHTTLTVDGGGPVPALTIVPNPDDPYGFLATPDTDLATEKVYRLKVSAGTVVGDRNLPIADDATFEFDTHPDFKFTGTGGWDVPSAAGQPFAPNPRGADAPLFESGSPALHFTTPIAIDEALAHVHVLRPVSSGELPFVPDGNDLLIDDRRFPPHASYRVAIDAGLRDVYGQILGKPEQLTITTSDRAGRFTAPEGIRFYRTEERTPIGGRAVRLFGGVYHEAVVRIGVENAASFDVGRELVQSDLRRDRDGGLSFLDQLLPIEVPQGFPEFDTWPAIAEPAGADDAEAPFALFDTGLPKVGTALWYGVEAETYTFPPGFSGPRPPSAASVADSLARDEPAVRVPLYSGLALRTDLFLSAIWSADAVRVRVQSARTRLPVTGAVVALGLFAGGQCVSAPTDADGEATLAYESAGACRDGSPLRFVIVASKGDDWTFLAPSTRSRYVYGRASDTERPDPFWRYRHFVEVAPPNWGLPWSPDRIARHLTATFDRTVYAPGDTVQGVIAGADRFRLGLKAVDEPFGLAIRSPDGSKTQIPSTVAVDGVSTFSFRLPATAVPGEYVLLSDLTNFSATFTVLGVRAAGFDVALSSDRAWVAPGHPAPLTTVVRTLIGEPAAGARVQLRATLAADAAPALARHTFDDYRFVFAKRPGTRHADERTRDLGAAAISLDGRERVPLAIGESDAPGIFTVEAEVVDEAGGAVSRQITIPAFPSAELIGTRVTGAKPGDSPVVSVVTIDPSGKPLAGRRLHLAVFAMGACGLASEPALDSTDIVSGDRPNNVVLQPLAIGHYRVLVTDGELHPGAPVGWDELDVETPLQTPSPTPTEAPVVYDPTVRPTPFGAPYAYLSDGSPLPPMPFTQLMARFDAQQSYLSFDRSSYAVGDVATVTLIGPGTRIGSFALTTPAGLRPMQRIAGNGDATFSFNVTSDLAHSSVIASFLRTDVEAPLELTTYATEAAIPVSSPVDLLKVDATASAAVVEPGGRVRVQVRARAFDGSVATGRAVVAVVDQRGVLERPDRPVLDMASFHDTAPDPQFGDTRRLFTLPVESTPFPAHDGRFFPQDEPRAVPTVTDTCGDASVRFPDAKGAPLTAGEPPPPARGFSLNGSLSAIAGAQYTAAAAHVYSNPDRYGVDVATAVSDANVRRHFAQTAYFNANVPLDARGEATVDVRLPDDVTTWHVFADVLSPGFRSGRGETTFVARRAIDAEPLTPRFLRPGDRGFAGIRVTNVSAPGSPLVIDGRASGGIAFAKAFGAATLPVLGYGRTTTLRYPLVTRGTGDGTLRFVASQGEARDGFDARIPIAADDARRTTYLAGRLDDPSMRLPLDVPEGPGATVDVSLSTTIAGELAPLVELGATNEFPDSGGITTRMRALADGVILARAASDPFAAERYRERLDQELARVPLYDHDGGFSDLPGNAESASDNAERAFVIAFERVGLAGAGGSVERHELAERLRGRFASVAGPCGNISCAEATSYAQDIAQGYVDMLLRLGQMPEIGDGDVCALLARADTLNSEASDTMARLPGCRARALARVRSVVAGLRERSRRTETGDAALVRAALDAGLDRERLERLETGLLHDRRGASYESVGDDVDALDALADVAIREPRGYVSAVAGLGANHWSVSLVGPRRASASKSFPVVRNGRPLPVLTLGRSGSAPLHYAIALHALPLDAGRGTDSGMHIDRIVRYVDAGDELSFGRDVLPDRDDIAAGTVLSVDDRIELDEPEEQVFVDDPIPAGFEAIDGSIATASNAERLSAVSVARSFGYSAIEDRRVIAFASELSPDGFGSQRSYDVRYLMRAVTPGNFLWPAASVAVEGEAETFGLTAVSRIRVRP